ncbi:AAA family ATPase [Evansella sp. AB-P1]|uniref:AAA family ATPase n=1 Tax=Evansella sp. AB-P1 TaxID=3037653 RepID=UPI00241EBB6E|nr:AAA family ATPase [Evansella sp. AB-P1]MDG5789616.1 AAA family ATPase [Evansella sp. AB-P1]
MKYNISEIHIENFKSIDSLRLSFENNDLIVLDGPNGFGKTTIFDAIELVLTGCIRRIVNIKIVDGNKGYDDYLFAKDQERPIIIKIKLINTEQHQNQLILGREIDHSSLARNKKKPGNFPSTLHKLTNIDDPLTIENIISPTQINLYETGDFEEKYRLYHYVEQEECTHLLKRSESDRMNALSKLFNIEKEETERQKLSKVKSKILVNKNKLLNKINGLEINLNIDTVNEKREEVEYIQLLPQKISGKVIWDKKALNNFTLDEKNNYFKQIDLFGTLKEQLDFFKAALKNEEINKSIHNKYRIEEALILYNFQEKIEEFKEEYNRKQKLKNNLRLLEEKDILNKNIDWDLIYEHFDLYIDYQNLKDKLTIIRNLKQNSSNLSTMISNLLKTKERLKEQFEEYLSKDENNNEHCPFCGANWENNKTLIKQINSQTEYFKTQLDQTSFSYTQLLDEIYTNYIKNLISDIKDNINKLISDDLYEEIKPYFDKKVVPTKVKGFFNKLNIDIEQFVYTNLDNIHDVSNRADMVIDKLKELIQDTGDFDYEKYKDLKDIYENILAKDDNLVNEIEQNNIKLKKDYINYVFYLQSSIQYRKYQDLKAKYDIIESAYNSISNVLEIYNKNIQSYRTKMIKEIEIPFYIYSGKIIQNYQRGIGIFIKEDNGGNDEIKTIRFVPPEKTDHDIMHTFSSGQLSATVLAFTLALHKVYNKSGLNTILIDDPIQTMDEMNMASFVELLRNDFGKQQIILSTHENQISLYFRYKFSKYGYQTQKLNIKDKLYR